MATQSHPDGPALEPCAPHLVLIVKNGRVICGRAGEEFAEPLQDDGSQPHGNGECITGSTTMLNTSDLESHESTNVTRRVPEKQHGWSRRALFGAAGGLVLAASGLALPDRLQEAEAAKHPANDVLHRKSQRRKKHRNERQRRRNEQRHDNAPQSGGEPWGPEGDSDVKLVVFNDTSAEIDTLCESLKWGGNDVIGYKEQNVAAGGDANYATFVKSARVYLDGSRHYIWVKNPLFGYPAAFVSMSGSKHQSGWRSLSVDEEFTVEYMNWKINVKRVDDDQRKVFNIHYSKK